MRKFFLILSAAASLASMASAADAATFTWSYTDGGSNTGSGTIEATQDLIDPVKFTIDSIAGTANGLSILGGPSPAYAGTGSAIYWTSSAPQVFDPLTPFYFTDFLGFAFAISATQYMAIYENTVSDDYACGEVLPYCLLGPGLAGSGLADTKIALTNFQVNLVPEVPLPAALPLLASSMAGLGFLARRRRRKAAV